MKRIKWDSNMERLLENAIKQAEREEEMKDSGTVLVGLIVIFGWIGMAVWTVVTLVNCLVSL